MTDIQTHDDSIYCAGIASRGKNIRMVVEVANAEQSKDVHGVFQVVGEMWDETLMKAVGSSSLATDKDAGVSASAADA